MTYTEILELIRAGYTKDEIQSLMDVVTPKAETPAEAPAPEPEPEPEAPKEEPKPEPTEVEKLISALGIRLDSLTHALQQRNVGEIESAPNTETADQILARIINPHEGG